MSYPYISQMVGGGGKSDIPLSNFAKMRGVMNRTTSSCIANPQVKTNFTQWHLWSLHFATTSAFLERA